MPKINFINMEMLSIRRYKHDLHLMSKQMAIRLATRLLWRIAIKESF